jgi:hypothetical protein
VDETLNAEWIRVKPGHKRSACLDVPYQMDCNDDWQLYDKKNATSQIWVSTVEYCYCVLKKLFVRPAEPVSVKQVNN